MKKTILLLIALLLVLVVCKGIHAPRPALRICVLQEISKAAPHNGVALISEKNFRDLIEKLSTAGGGELAFGTITGRDVSLARMRVQGETNAYQHNGLKKRVAGYRTQVVDLLSVPLAQHPDPTSAIYRANMFFREHPTARQYLIYVGGAGQTTVPAIAVPGVRVLVVATRTYRPQIPNATYLEAIGPAIDLINNKEQENDTQ